MGLATTFVLTLTAVASHAVERWLLAPFGLEYLRTLSFILVIASVVQFTEMFIRKTSPVLYNILGSSCRSSPPTAPCSAWPCSMSAKATA